MNERKISLGPTIAQQDRAHARLIKRRASSERGAGPQGMVLNEVRGNTLSLGNTICPKIGAAQWTCTKDECTCHLKETIKKIKPEQP